MNPNSRCGWISIWVVKAASALVTFAGELGISSSVLLFFLPPTALAGGVAWFFPGMPMWVRTVEGAVRIVIFLAYLCFAPG